MLRTNVHIGPIIRKVFLEKKKAGKITLKEFANAVGRDRTRIYPIFESKSVDTDLLVRISKILDYPFLLEYFDMDAPIVVYLVLAEVGKSKMESMLDDKSVKIIKTWSNV